MAAPPDAAIPPGSLILVTGCGGFIGSHVSDQLLQLGYHVRGTARSTEKTGWIKEHFDKTYGEGKFELVEVKNISEKGSLDEVIKGCDGLAHVATDLSLSPDPNVVVTGTIEMMNNVLEAAGSSPSLKRVVFTSSSAAAAHTVFNEKYDLKSEDWNDAAVKAAWAPPPYGPDRVMYAYMASKVESEKALWKFVKERKPGFVASTVLPDFTVGKIINTDKQGFPSSVGLVNMIYNNDSSMMGLLPPGHEIDVQDVARLHVAALLKPDITGERIFAYNERKNWTNTIEKLKKLYPGRSYPDPPADEGEDLANIVQKPRALELLKYLGQEDFVSYEDSLRMMVESIK